MVKLTSVFTLRLARVTPVEDQATCLASVYCLWGGEMIFLHSCEIKSGSGLETKAMGQTVMKVEEGRGDNR